MSTLINGLISSLSLRSFLQIHDPNVALVTDQKEPFRIRLCFVQATQRDPDKLNNLQINRKEKTFETSLSLRMPKPPSVLDPHIFHFWFDENALSWFLLITLRFLKVDVCSKNLKVFYFLFFSLQPDMKIH